MTVVWQIPITSQASTQSCTKLCRLDVVNNVLPSNNSLSGSHKGIVGPGFTSCKHGKQDVEPTVELLIRVHLWLMKEVYQISSLYVPDYTKKV